jgi:hypothetical protein
LTPQISRRIGIQYLRQIVQNSSKLPFKPEFNNTLFVHIRSGDIFDFPPSHSGYIQPPYDYYRFIFSMETDKRIVVLYEDDKNPVVNALQQNYPNILFYSLPILETIYVFLNAKYIVLGNGTFIPAILCMNNVCKKIYNTDIIFYSKSIWDKTCENSCFVHLPKYINKWENTTEQREFMITYKGAHL